MIGLGAITHGQIRRTEISTTSDQTEVLQALIAAPEPMNAREIGAWQLICSGILEGNDVFVKEDIFSFGGQAGIAPKLSWSNEALCLQFVAPRGGESTVARLVESLLSNLKLDDERLQMLRARLAAPLPDDWSARLMGERGDLSIPTEFVQRFADRALRPENLILVGTAGTLKATEGRFQDWRPRRVSPDIRVTNSALFRGPDNAKTMALVAGPFRPSTSEAATCLAMVALGGGKSALLHQVLRESKGWTYRQEALLRPETAGWRPMIVIQSTESLPTRTEVVQALMDATDKISTIDLERFKTLAGSAIDGFNPMSPFRFFETYQGTPQHRATWMAFATLWGTQNTTPESLLSDCKRVTLDELKDAIKKLLGQLMDRDP